eukprot:6080801-Pleurochrysis_carterae.AAC.1
MFTPFSCNVPPCPSPLSSHEPVLSIISKRLVRKALDMFNEIAKDEDKFKSFSDNFGKYIKVRAANGNVHAVTMIRPKDRGTHRGSRHMIQQALTVRRRRASPPTLAPTHAHATMHAHSISTRCARARADVPRQPNTDLPLAPRTLPPSPTPSPAFSLQ